RSIRCGAVGAIALRAEAVESGVRAAGSDLEDHTKIVGAAAGGGAVEVAVGTQRQPGVGSRAVGTAGVRTEAVKRRPRAGGRNLENRAAVAGPAEVGRAVEISVGALDERAEQRLAAVGAPRLRAEAVQAGENLRRRQDCRTYAEQKNDKANF